MRLFTKTIRFFSSVKTAVILIILLVILSVSGTIIIQNQGTENYIFYYGKTITSIITFFKFDNVYHSPPFISLLILISLNIIICTLYRIKNIIKHTLSNKTSIPVKGDNKILNADLDTCYKSANNYFKKNKFKTIKKNKDNYYIVLARKHIAGAFSSAVTHISILIILLGALLGALFGISYTLTLEEKKETLDKYTGNIFRLEKFTVDYYEKTGTPRLYQSDISIISNGKSIKEFSVTVNKPVTLNKVQFSQMSWGLAQNIKNAEINIHDTVRKTETGFFTAKVNDIVNIDSTIKIQLIGYVPDYNISNKSRSELSSSHNNPALKIKISGKNKTEKIILLLKDKNSGYSEKFNLKFDLNRILPVLYSVLYAVRDPGMPFIYTGFLLLFISMVLMLYMKYIKYIIFLKTGTSGTELLIKKFNSRREIDITKDEYKKIFSCD